MLTTLNMALARCPMGFSEEIERERVFPNKKSQSDTENDKNPKILYIFSKFLGFFRQIFDRLSGLECD